MPKGKLRFIEGGGFTTASDHDKTTLEQSQHMSSRIAKRRRPASRTNHTKRIGVTTPRAWLARGMHTRVFREGRSRATRPVATPRGAHPPPPAPPASPLVARTPPARRAAGGGSNHSAVLSRARRRGAHAGRAAQAADHRRHVRCAPQRARRKRRGGARPLLDLPRGEDATMM